MYDSLFYHASWLQVFLPFQFSFFQVKMVNYYEGYENFQDTEYQLQENTLHHYPHCRFLSTQLKSSTDNFCSISLPYCLFISQYLIYDDSVFIKNFHVLVASFRLWMNGMTYPTPFSTIKNISISVNRSNFTLVFFKDACNANPHAERQCSRSSPYISRKILRKLLNTLASNNVSFSKYKSWNSP